MVYLLNLVSILYKYAFYKNKGYTKQFWIDKAFNDDVKHNNINEIINEAKSTLIALI